MMRSEALKARPQHSPGRSPGDLECCGLPQPGVRRPAAAKWWARPVSPWRGFEAGRPTARGKPRPTTGGDRSPHSGFATKAGIAALAFFLAGCKESPPTLSTTPPPPPDTLRQLDELSVEQRRVFLRGFPGDWRADTDMARGIEEPAATLPLPEDARIIDLPDTAGLQLGAMPLSEAIARRRSRREFSDQPLSLDQLSFLLQHTQGITAGTIDEPGEVTRRFRASPSGGGRYPLETFLAVQRIAGLDPGLYRYLPEEHRLLVIAEDAEIGGKIQQACYGDSTVRDAAVVFIWAAVPCRTEWKYGCISHKMIAMEAGHVCQNLYLAAESIGAGTCAMLGYHQPALDELIGADGNEIFAVYVAPVGMVLPP